MLMVALGGARVTAVSTGIWDRDTVKDSDISNTVSPVVEISTVRVRVPALNVKSVVTAV